MKIERVWAMPNKWTFSMKPMKELLSRYNVGKLWADPFAGKCSPATETNDIEDRGAKYQMDALDFLKILNENTMVGVLFDPPYSTEQCLRRYTPKHNGTAGRAEYWAKCKDEIARVVKPNGYVISCCWDSTGMGKKRGFEIMEILLICHGACHNDTIVTVERKIALPTKQQQLSFTSLDSDPTGQLTSGYEATAEPTPKSLRDFSYPQDVIHNNEKSLPDGEQNGY